MRNETSNSETNQKKRPQKATGGQVICTQPRINNCIGAFEGTKAVHKYNSGYKTALESRNETAKVLYVTDGMIAAHGVNECDVLIVDECHERNVNMNLILLMARKGYCHLLMVML